MDHLLNLDRLQIKIEAGIKMDSGERKEVMPESSVNESLNRGDRRTVKKGEKQLTAEEKEANRRKKRELLKIRLSNIGNMIFDTALTTAIGILVAKAMDQKGGGGSGADHIDIF